ncbi:hypothetical protein HDC92_004678 [Pedobacter sp. AK017]|uniref:DUF1566 domain-containing protein n=1 Tax=Pedobacter sp. AK017 TaxID=2723073 RepID=UPI0016185717|nr:DUF1566 domain-containing protein [Pedobacter sp. AK017]MBB5440974.1 hypothetical protein [Pedobacter sp. AK017]
MKRILFIFLYIFSCYQSFAQGLSKNGEITNTGTIYVNKNGAIGSPTGVNKNGQIVLAATLPNVSTTAITSITYGAAASGGNVTNDGGAVITSKGVCWSTNPGPTITLNTKTTDGTGVGSFNSGLTGLTLGTMYYVRAYAVNSVGTGYGTEVSFTTSATIAVGDSYQGGKVAYLLSPGDLGYNVNVLHGFIAAISDQANARWGTENLVIPGADGTAVGTGLQNTIDIMATEPIPLVAARLCRGVTINGYSDWYLPSKDELHQLFINRALVGGFNPAGWYISSTEYNNDGYNGWYEDFSNGNQSWAPKDWALGVRAIRSF